MARGKQTCKILKEIRRQIAEANDIEFVTSECRYKGDCLGTCPNVRLRCDIWSSSSAPVNSQGSWLTLPEYRQEP